MSLGGYRFWDFAHEADGPLESALDLVELGIENPVRQLVSPNNLGTSIIGIQ